MRGRSSGGSHIAWVWYRKIFERHGKHGWASNQVSEQFQKVTEYLYNADPDNAGFFEKVLHPAEWKEKKPADL